MSDCLILAYYYPTIPRPSDRFSSIHVSSQARARPFLRCPTQGRGGEGYQRYDVHPSVDRAAKSAKASWTNHKLNVCQCGNGQVGSQHPCLPRAFFMSNSRSLGDVMWPNCRIEKCPTPKGGPSCSKREVNDPGSPGTPMARRVLELQVVRTC